MKKLMVLDGNSIVNRAFYGVSQNLTTRDGQPTNAVFGFLAILNKLLDECDVVVPVTQIAKFLGYVESLEETVGLKVRSFGHAGDGNLHIYCCSNDLEEEEFKARAEKFMEAVYVKATELGGQVSGEHGIGHGKVPYLAESVGEVNMRLMEQIKQVFDPNLILNPGKVGYKL